jgi:hypothetical protein
MEFLNGKSILIISPEGWGKSYLSKHHYAIELAKSNKVWFLNPPHTQVSETDTSNLPENLRLLNDRQIPGLRHFPQRLQRFIISKQYDALENKAGVKFQIVWNFDNSRYFHNDCFYDAYTIHHVVDEHMNYNFGIASRSAELCLGVTQQLVQTFKKYNEHAHFIDHAFAPFDYTTYQLPQNNLRKSASYVGNLLLPALDTALLIELAEENPDTDFYLIGSFGHNHLNVISGAKPNADLITLQNMSNVVMTGELSFQDAFTIASQTDIQMVPYFKTSRPMTNSSKLPFYLNNGKVIVGNEFSEHMHHGLIRMAGTAHEFKLIFSDTLDHLQYWNSEDKQHQRRQFALENTYQKRIDYIDRLISDSQP